MYREGERELQYTIQRLFIGGKEGYRLAEDGYQLGGRRFLKTTSISPTGGIRRGANI